MPDAGCAPTGAVEQPARTASSRQCWIGPVGIGLAEEAFVQQEVFAREARQRSAERLRGLQQQAHGLLAIAAQRVRRRGIFGEPQAHGLDIGVGGDLPVRATRAIGAGAAVERGR